MDQALLILKVLISNSLRTI